MGGYLSPATRSGCNSNLDPYTGRDVFSPHVRPSGTQEKAGTFLLAADDPSSSRYTCMMAVRSKPASPRARDVHERLAALERFAHWDTAHPSYAEPAAALSGLGLLYDLLPAEARRRPVDASGVGVLHRDLSVLGTTPR